MRYVRARTTGEHENGDCCETSHDLYYGVSSRHVQDHSLWKAATAKAALKVFEETERRGVLIGKGALPGNVIRLGPPLIAMRYCDRMKEIALKKIVLVVLCLVFATVAFAEEDHHDCMMMAGQQQAQDAKLQGLVDTMNKTTGQAKVDAMAAVINELIAQRTAMRDEMHEMMMHHMGEMKGQSKDHSMENCPMMKSSKPSKKS